VSIEAWKDPWHPPSLVVVVAVVAVVALGEIAFDHHIEVVAVVAFVVAACTVAVAVAEVAAAS